MLPMRKMAGIAALLAGGFALGACILSSRPVAKEIVVFVDFSQSIGPETKALIKQDFENLIIPSLSSGDRILIAPINENTLTSFHPLLDEKFPANPRFNGWADNTLKHGRETKAIESEMEAIRERIRSRVPGILDEGGSSTKTDIFGSLLMAEKLFDAGERQKVLILMSDMIVDSAPYRFDTMSWSPEVKEKLLAELQANNLIPDLSGVCVYVSGATAASAQLAAQIGDFWHSYFARTGADLDPSRYAHVLLHWPPSDACSS